MHLRKIEIFATIRMEGETCGLQEAEGQKARPAGVPPVCNENEPGR